MKCETKLKPDNTPFDNNYYTEEDISPLYCPEDHFRYHYIIGNINWRLFLGCFNVHYAFNSLSQYSLPPRKEHLPSAQKHFGYLSKHFNIMIVIDHDIPPIWTLANFCCKCNLIEFFPYALEDLPTKCLLTHGNPIKITAYVDADYAHTCITCCYINGVLLLINNKPLLWVLQWQCTVKTDFWFWYG